MNVLYEPAAQAEVTEVVLRYLEVAGRATADAFERELDTAIYLLRFPMLGAPGLRSSCKLRLDGFTYTLHYRLDGELIRILAVANQRRKPGYWGGR